MPLYHTEVTIGTCFFLLFFLDAWEYDEHFYSQPVEHCYIYEILVVYPQTFKGIVDTTCTHAYPFPDPQHNKKGEHG